MKKLFIIVFIFIYVDMYSHENVYTHKIYNDVELNIHTYTYSEKIYIACIIGQYVDLLKNKDKKFNKIILNFFEEKTQENDISTKNKYVDYIGNVLTIDIRQSVFDIDITLNIINSVLQNNVQKGTARIIHNEINKEVNDILNIRIDRPNFIPELEKGRVTYYFKDSKFNFYYLSLIDKNEINIISYDLLENFYSLSNDLFLVFTDLLRMQLINIRTEQISKTIPLHIKELYVLQKIELLNNDKILIRLKQESQDDILMIYFINKNVLIENIDEIIK